MSPCWVTPASLSSLTPRPSASSASCVRLRRGHEAGDVALEEQLVACWILEGEGDERADALLQRGAGVTRVAELVEPVEQLLVAVGEHRVVQRVLGVEVLVERRLAHPHLAGEGVQRDPGDPVFSSELPGGATIEATLAARRCATLSAIGRTQTPIRPVGRPATVGASWCRHRTRVGAVRTRVTDPWSSSTVMRRPDGCVGSAPPRASARGADRRPVRW